MNKLEEIINEMRKTTKETFEGLFYRPIQKIKMKEEIYNQVAREAQELVNISEVLDINRQPLNRLCGVRIEIDNNIENDYEVVR